MQVNLKKGFFSTIRMNLCYSPEAIIDPWNYCSREIRNLKANKEIKLET